MSDLLDREGCTPSWSSLVPINTEGSRPPLFLVHAGGGNIISYRTLSRYLGADQPVWGLQAQGLRTGQEPSYQIESIAESYLEAIRSQQSRGPYYLGGHSIGALIALEMAQRLQTLGEQVAFVAVLDHAGPDARVGWIDWVRWQLICLSQLEMRDRWRFVSDGLRYKVRVNRKLPNPAPSDRGRVARQERRSAEKRHRGCDSSRHHWRRLENYKIRPYPGRIDLFAPDWPRPEFTQTPGAVGVGQAWEAWWFTRSRATT